MVSCPDIDPQTTESSHLALSVNTVTSSLKRTFPSLTEEQRFQIYQEIYESVWRIQLAPYFTGFSDEQMLIILKVIPECARLVHTDVYSVTLESLMDENPFLSEYHSVINKIAGKHIPYIVPAIRELIKRGILSVDFQNLPPMKDAPDSEEP